MSDREFVGKIAVVTGAGSGIGRSSAKLLAEHGAKVHCVDINGERAEETAAAIVADGGEAVVHVTDTSDLDAVSTLAERVYAEDSRVDILHNNAGIGHAAPTVDTTPEDWRRVIDINLMGVANGIQAFVPRMLGQGGGAQIVNTASMAGLTPSAGMTPYVTSKFGVVGMSLSLDAELKPKGIRVMALCPGVISTNIVAESAMGGSVAGKRDQLVNFYKTRGVSPDVVAKDMVNGMRRGSLIKPSPWWQVSPGWWLIRISPRAYNALAGRIFKKMFGG